VVAPVALYRIRDKSEREKRYYFLADGCTELRSRGDANVIGFATRRNGNGF
jgi:hypothetical protein